MTTVSTARRGHSVALDTSTTARVRLLAVSLGAVAAAVGGLSWLEPAGGGDADSYTDIAPVREPWWALLKALAAVGLITVTLQALATMILVRVRAAPGQL